MNEQDRLERTRQALDLLRTHHASRRELELRAAGYEVLEVPIPLRNALLEEGERIAKTEEELDALVGAAPAGAAARRVRAACLRRAQAEVAHVQRLLRKRRANASELARREAAHGPGAAPLQLIHHLKAEREAVEALEERLRRAEVEAQALSETAPEEMEEDSEILATLRLFIATPDGARYETQVLADTLVVRLQSALLADWQPPEDAGPARYTLRRDPQGPPLNPGSTLEEVGLAEGATLHLVPEPLTGEAPVGLTVEDAEGNRYVTKVRLDTRVEALGTAFMEMMRSGGQAVVELAGGSGDYRPLRHDATLYDEQVGEGARLRISPAA
jgi:hypothetical protein